MITTNELRVGIWLNYDTEEEEGVLPTKIDWQDIKWAEHDIESFNKVHSPIPLTEEILKKLGFIEAPPVYRDKDAYVIGKDAERYVWSENEIYKPMSGQGHYIKVSRGNIDSLHKLQNWFYFNTTEELIYSPN